MIAFIIILLIIILINYEFLAKLQMDLTMPKYNGMPINYSIDIKDICKTLEDKDSKKPELKELQDQLAAQKELNQALREKYEKYEKPDKKNNLYDNDPSGLVGDDIFTNRVVEMNKRSKDALDNRAMWDKTTFIPYLEEELQEHAGSVWWDDDALENMF